MKHLSHQYEEDLQRLKEGLLLMGGTLESMMKDAFSALRNKDRDMAMKIIERDSQLDEMEKKIDEQAIELLALRQPAAGDLRFITACMKICTDLERMADGVVNICERIAEHCGMRTTHDVVEIEKMFMLATEMVAKSLDAFVHSSLDAASEVLRTDAEMDQLFRSAYRILLDEMVADSQDVEPALKLLFIAKYLERIADHATNISEQVIFSVRGLDIRHSDFPSPTP